MSHGGRRVGSGRKQEAAGFRQWCRHLFNDPKVRAAVRKRAKEDPEFALRIAEHGWGRPPQALDVKVGNSEESPLVVKHKLDVTGLSTEELVILERMLSSTKPPKSEKNS